MCGILVDLRFRGRSDPARLSRGLDVLAPRGPDGRGHHADGPLWMGHTRLAMVDRPGAHQPMVLDGGDLCVVVNGELYGVDAIERRLAAAGHRVPPGSDARVVGPLYRAHGLAFVEHLEGEWAVVLWDRRRRRLVAARDPLGVRPLFVAEDPTGVRLASSAAALLASGASARWSRSAVAQLFQHQYLLPGATLFEGIRSVLPGGQLVVEPGAVQERRWWALPLPEVSAPAPDLLEALDAAVRVRLRGTAPVGVQLSGGVDSAAVTALAARASPGITAWTVAFVDDPTWDEAALARRVADACGADHRVVPTTQADLLQDVVASVVAGGAPVINLHGAARYRLSRAVRAAGVRGLLTGEGADELLYGYAHLRHDHARSLGTRPDTGRDEPVAAAVHLPWGPSLDTAPLAAALGTVPTFLAAKAALAHRARTLLATPSAWPVDFGDLRRALATGPLRVSAAPGGSGRPTSVQTSAWLWTHLCLSGSILATLCDPQELAHGVEGRLPFLDRRVRAAALALSDHQKLRGGIEKAVFRDALAGTVPDVVRLRPKQPFMAPPLATTPGLRRLFASLDCPPFLSRAGVHAALEAARQARGPARTAWDPVLCLALSLSVLQSEHGLAAP